MKFGLLDLVTVKNEHGEFEGFIEEIDPDGTIIIRLEYAIDGKPVYIAATEEDLS